MNKINSFLIVLLSLSMYGCLFTQQKPPEAVAVKLPTSTETGVAKDDTILLFIINKNKINYHIGKIVDSSKATIITQVNHENLIAVLDKVEAEYPSVLSEKKILIKSNMPVSDTEFNNFKILKSAFKEKGILRFRMVTTNN